jgi:hypothetical protein
MEIVNECIKLLRKRIVLHVKKLHIWRMYDTFGNHTLYLLWRALYTEADRDIYILFSLISAIFSVSIDIGM